MYTLMSGAPIGYWFDYVCMYVCMYACIYIQYVCNTYIQKKFINFLYTYIQYNTIHTYIHTYIHTIH